MDAVAVLRQLWRQRRLMAVGFALALVAGTLLTHGVSVLPPKLKSHQYLVGTATASALIDSARSQVADLGGAASRADVASLSARAQLLTNLLATSPLRERIARRAGIAPETLVTSAPQDTDVATNGSNDSNGTTLDKDDRRASVLTLSVRESVPIVTAAVTAPNRTTAGRVASATIAQLEEYLKSVASTDRVPDARRLVVDPLGTAHSATETRGPRKLLMLGVIVAFFGLWCAGMLAFQGFARGWRRAAELESGEVRAPRVAPRPEPRVAPRAEPRVKEQAEPRVKPRVEPQVQSGLSAWLPPPAKRRPGLASVPPPSDPLSLPERVRPGPPPTRREPAVVPQRAAVLPERPVRRPSGAQA